MSKINKLLVEKYRPSTIDGYVFQSKEMEATVRKWIKQGNIPNVLLCGTAGVGKTTLARILVNELELQPSDVKEVNASLLKTADIENELIPWMKKVSFGKFKVIVLDEADRIDPNHGQKILRHVIEEFSDNVRFIATCNFANKIIAPLHSRFQTIEIDAMDYDGVLDLVVDIVEKEELSFAEPEHILGHIDAYNPDIRKILNSIDQHTGENGVIAPLSSATGGGESLDAWEDLWKGDSFSIESAINMTDLIDQSNFEEFYHAMYMNSSKFPDEVKGVVLLSQYLDRAQHSANQMLHLRACLYHIFLMED